MIWDIVGWFMTWVVPAITGWQMVRWVTRAWSSYSRAETSAMRNESLWSMVSWLAFVIVMLTLMFRPPVWVAVLYLGVCLAVIIGAQICSIRWLRLEEIDAKREVLDERIEALLDTIEEQVDDGK